MSGPDATRDALARARSALLAHMRHELLDPVNAIFGYTEMLIEDAGAHGRADLVTDLQKIRASGQSLHALIDEAVAAGRAAPVPTDLPTFATQMQYRLRGPLNTIIGYSELLAEQSVGLGESFDSDLIRIGDAGHRLHALINDIANFRARTSDTPKDSSPAWEIVLPAVNALVKPWLITSNTGGGRLLVVDDSEVSRDLLARRLERDSHTVTRAANGAEALRLLNEAEIDLLLLDLMMPEMSGFELLGQLKSDERLRAIPIIVISALGETDGPIRCIEMGAEDYLPKPCDPILLRARVGACLEKKRLRDQEQLYIKELCAEREKSERLLLNVLPRAVAEQLREQPGFIAERYEEVTVLFADIVGFTEWSAAVQAVEVVQLLNNLFSRFDSLTERHGLEKIKTIGDCYMVAGGIPAPRADHAEAVAEMALDMQSELACFNGEFGLSLSIRTGIHTGSVVAGIIGTRKFIYDLWGNTVNTASRMESHGAPGRIQVTDETRSRLDGKYLFDLRGELEVRGRGTMTTYFLTGRLEKGCSDVLARAADAGG
jgi:adenylate cyclase